MKPDVHWFVGYGWLLLGCLRLDWKCKLFFFCISPDIRIYDVPIQHAVAKCKVFMFEISSMLISYWTNLFPDPSSRYRPFFMAMWYLRSLFVLNSLLHCDQLNGLAFHLYGKQYEMPMSFPCTNCIKWELLWYFYVDIYEGKKLSDLFFWVFEQK